MGFRIHKALIIPCFVAHASIAGKLNGNALLLNANLQVSGESGREVRDLNAETLNCPTCGAAVSTAATHCSFCDARLATVACPRCFAMMFVGSLHCSRCGAKATKAEKLEAASRLCPRCRVEMEAIAVGSATLRECARCDGMWVDVESFEKIINEREEHSAVLGAPTQVQKRSGESHEPNKVRYVPCPECNQLMNRVNFARCSGVVVDVCKGHGTWFDHDELQQIIEFVQSGGLGASRVLEKREIVEERARLQREQLAAISQHNPLLNMSSGEDRRSGVVSAARELLKLMLD
ncbi:MAG TPA: zf-TFIIB domain-containing protein [Pyrinomonadaceae bacterium]|nr:zf-TFIIB domain-containing protein [Pyrinomonadaceae bacterium]